MIIVHKPMKTLQLTVKFTIAFAIWCSLLFMPAGTLLWPEAWALLIILFVYTWILFAFVMKSIPRSLQSRERYRPKYGIDFFISIPSAVGILSLFVIPPLDVFHYHWSDRYVPLVLKYLGVSLYTVALVLFTVVMKVNPFLSRVVEVQEDQKLITTGPYGVVRHPMYAANALFFVGVPLMLGSLIALIPALALILIFVARLLFEERVLERDLPGYAEYMKQVRYRMIPGVW